MEQRQQHETSIADWVVPGLIVLGVVLSLAFIGSCIVYMQWQAAEEARARQQFERARQAAERLIEQPGATQDE